MEKAVREAVIDVYTQQLKEVDKICPVTLEPFCEDNPPYQIDCCSHRLSIEALSHLTVYRLNYRPGTSYQLCPVCLGKIHFATIDPTYLLLVSFSQDLENLPNAMAGSTDSSIQKSVEQKIKMRKIDRDIFPKLFQPKGGILGILNELAKG